MPGVVLGAGRLATLHQGPSVHAARAWPVPCPIILFPGAILPHKLNLPADEEHDLLLSQAVSLSAPSGTCMHNLCARAAGP